MTIYDISGRKIVDSGTHSIEGFTEMGGISSGYNTNADVLWNTRSEMAYRVHGECVNPLSIHIDGMPSEQDSVYVFFYDSDGAYVGSQKYAGSEFAFPMMAGASVFKIQVSHSSSVKRRERFVITCENAITEVYNSNIINASVGDSLAFCYSVTDDAETSGRLLLPPNYTIDGKKVPLIVFAHGSGCMLSWNAKLGDVIDGSTHISYLPYLQYLANEGFAVFDCYPWTNGKSIPTETWSPFNIPMHRQAYLKGIEYVCSRFNVDIDRVSLLCKSQGGHIAQWAVVQDKFRFKAVSLFAPSCILGGTLFFNAKCRQAIAEYVQFNATADELTAFIEIGSYYKGTDEQKALMRSFVDKNKDILASMSPTTQGLANGTADDIVAGCMTPLYELPQWMIDIGLPEKPEGSQPLFAIAENPDYVRSSFTPSKFWAAFDDDQSSGYLHYAAYHWLSNGASDTAFRELPVGTGGHHAMDTDVNALKSSGTTALGIEYVDIPTAYVEVVEFIRSKCGG